MLYSQSHVFQDFHWDNTPGMELVSQTQCSALSEDLDTLQRLKQLHPGRIKAIRYEDVATSPHEYARGIYEFLDLDYSDLVKKKVTELTSSTEKGDDDAYSVYRSNPVETMQKWKRAAGFTTVNVIDNTCHKLYPVLGYRRVTSDRDLMSNQSVVTQPETRYGVF